MRVADYIMSRLHEAGIDHIFMVTGRGALFLTDAVAKHPGLEAVCVHHEQSAAFAAVSYAQQKGHAGACLVSTGCASTNTITGVLSAWQDGVPCVFISGQNTLQETSRHTGIPVRTYGQQEADIVALVAPITKYATMLQSAGDIVQVMDEALRQAHSGRKGPVWIDVPLDLQSAQIYPLEAPAVPSVASPAERGLPAPCADDVASVRQALAQALRPVVLIGSGVQSAGARSGLQDFVEARGLPLVYAASASDTYGTAHPLSIGSVGAMGCSRAGNFAVQNADLVLVLGSRLSSLTTGPDFCKFARAAQVMVVDLDAVEHSKVGIRIDRLVVADVGQFIAALHEPDAPSVNPQWLARCQHWKQIFGQVEPAFAAQDRVDLYQLAEALSKALPSESTLLTDSGLAEVILPTNVRFGPGMRCIHPVSQGAMGFALPAAIGAYVARQQTTVAVIGDGSIMMNLQELESIRHRQLPIKILVINNNVYSIIRRRQQDLFRKRTIGTDPDNGVSCPDFAKVADCFGLDYLRIDSPQELDDGLLRVMAHPGRLICEIMGRVDQGYIEVAHTRSEIDKRAVRRPLEDQSPFLDRELFRSEMLVDPIDQ